ncbi:MAG: hypothetical protein P8186_07445 [Anaerolineae bacterium]|jgi:hypothetical protein
MLYRFSLHLLGRPHHSLLLWREDDSGVEEADFAILNYVFGPVLHLINAK